MPINDAEIQRLYRKFASPLDSYATSPVRKNFVDYVVQLLWKTMIAGHGAEREAERAMREVRHMKDGTIEAIREVYYDQMCPLISEHELAALREHYNVVSAPMPPLRFKVGDHVRVRQGVTDVDYADISLAGWAGTVARIYSNGLYLVRWSQETLENAPAVYRQRCKRDAKTFDRYRFREDLLESDPGEGEA